MGRQHVRKMSALLPAHVGQGLQHGFETGHECRDQRFLLRGVLRRLFLRLQNAPHGQQAVETRRGRVDLALGFKRTLKLQDLLDQFPVHRQRLRRGLAGEHQRDRKRATAKLRADQLAGRDLQRVESAGQTKPDIETLAVDRLDLPTPLPLRSAVTRIMGSLDTGVTRHAVDRHSHHQIFAIEKGGALYPCPVTATRRGAV